MNKKFGFLIIIIIFLISYSEIHNIDTDIPFISSSFETYPYFLEMHNTNNFLEYINIEKKTDYFITENENIVNKIFFDESYNRTFYDENTNITFLEKNTIKSLYYGINLINNIYINKIYSSLYLKNGDYLISGYTNINLLYDNPYNYYNQIFFNYKKILVFAELNENDKEFDFGYLNKNFMLLTGYNTDEYIPINTVIKYGKMSMLTNSKYYYNSENFENNALFCYSYNYNRLFVVPVIKYDEALKLSFGLLYRLYPSFSLFSNISYTDTLKTGELGIKYSVRDLLFNGMCEYDINNNFIDYKISSVYENDFIRTELNISYDSLFVYSYSAYIHGSFYDDNLKPGIYIQYNDENELKTYLITKLIDAYLFFGNIWLLDNESYILHGGIQWYFYENL